MREHRQPVSDDTPMPFGEHRGTPLRDVPAAYLLWWARQSWAREWSGLWAYVERNHAKLVAKDPGNGISVEAETAEFSDYQSFLDYH